MLVDLGVVPHDAAAEICRNGAGSDHIDCDPARPQLFSQVTGQDFHRALVGP